VEYRRWESKTTIFRFKIIWK